MNTTREEQECREALEAAEEMAAECRKQVAEFPPEARELGEKILAAADRTVLNLRLALQSLIGESTTVN